MEPTDLAVADSGVISIVWSDGHRSVYSPFKLRSACPCAMCQGEPGVFGRHYEARKQLIPEDVQVTEIGSIGRYALKFTWSDGHNLGIYSFDNLRRLCECADCKSE